MPGGEWFRGASVNLASEALRHVEAAEASGHPEIICENELGEVQTLGWAGAERKAHHGELSNDWQD